jgi:hypothetical protein
VAADSGLDAGEAELAGEGTAAAGFQVEELPFDVEGGVFSVWQGDGVERRRSKVHSRCPI